MPTDVFLWDYIMEWVFHLKAASLNEFHLQITDAVASVTPQMLENTQCETEYCLYVKCSYNKLSVQFIQTQKKCFLIFLALCVIGLFGKVNKLWTLFIYTSYSPIPSSHKTTDWRIMTCTFLTKHNSTISCLW